MNRSFRIRFAQSRGTIRSARAVVVGSALLAATAACLDVDALLVRPRDHASPDAPGSDVDPTPGSETVPEGGLDADADVTVRPDDADADVLDGTVPTPDGTDVLDGTVPTPPDVEPGDERIPPPDVEPGDERIDPPTEAGVSTCTPSVAWTTNEDAGLGAGPCEVATGITDVRALATDGPYLYFVGELSWNKGVYRVPLAATSSVPHPIYIANGAETLRALAVTPDGVYFAMDGNPGRIGHHPVDGGPVEFFEDSMPNINTLAVTDAAVIWGASVGREGLRYRRHGDDASTSVPGTDTLGGTRDLQIVGNLLLLYSLQQSRAWGIQLPGGIPVEAGSAAADGNLLRDLVDSGILDSAAPDLNNLQFTADGRYIAIRLLGSGMAWAAMGFGPPQTLSERYWRLGYAGSVSAIAGDTKSILVGSPSDAGTNGRVLRATKQPDSLTFQEVAHGAGDPLRLIVVGSWIYAYIRTTPADPATGQILRFPIGQ